MAGLLLILIVLLINSHSLWTDYDISHILIGFTVPLLLINHHFCLKEIMFIYYVCVVCFFIYFNSHLAYFKIFLFEVVSGKLCVGIINYSNTYYYHDVIFLNIWLYFGMAVGSIPMKRNYLIFSFPYEMMYSLETPHSP